MGIVSTIRNFFAEDDFYPEVARANFHKLPESLKIEWFKNGKYIVAKIEANGREFRTQGKGADDFVFMVNDCIYTAYGIKPHHKDQMLKIRSFLPSEEDWIKLNDGQVKKSEFCMSRKLVAA